MVPLLGDILVGLAGIAKLPWGLLCTYFYRQSVTYLLVKVFGLGLPIYELSIEGDFVRGGRRANA